MKKQAVNQSKSKVLTKSLMSALVAGGMLLGVGTQAQAKETLRVCAASNELPYSNKQEQGFENEIAKVLAKQMGRDLEFVWSDKAAIFLVTEHLLRNECDVVMGVDTEDPRIATSTPYYRSGYAFIYPDNKGLDIKNWQSNDLKNMNKFAIVPGSPSEMGLREIGKYEGNFNYTKAIIGFKSRRNEYVRYAPDMMVSEVVSGNADLAHIWAPEAARYVNNASIPLKMVMSEEVIQLRNGESVQQHFDQSVGVREDDKQLLENINTALKKAESEIKQILTKEGVPLL